MPKETIHRNVKKWLLRIPAGILACTGLTYPVCAAVCPKGIGSCPTPGRCFLFTDSDGNSICDYTSGSVSTGDSTSTGTQSAASVAQTPANGTSSGSAVSTGSAPVGTTHTAASGAANSGIFDYLFTNSLVIGTILFIFLTLALFWVFRSGKIKMVPGRNGSRLALAGLLSLGISEISVYFLTGAMAYASVFALVYMVIGTSLTIYLWKDGEMSRTIVFLIAGISTLAGFTFAAPVMPTEFTGLVSLALGHQTITVAILAVAVLFALTFLFGRMFCAHICPVGSIQELAYGVLPGKKIVPERSGYLEISRFVIFLLVIAAGIYAINLMEFTGLYDFFALTGSGLFFIGAALVILSFFLYRPICRILCPFGAVFSVLAHFGIGNLSRTEGCIRCGKCEKVCPVHAVGEHASKRECYLCGRCREVCPKDAIRFSSVNRKEKYSEES